MFDDKAHDHDPWSWVAMHRAPAAAAAAVVGAGAWLLGRRR
jgi:hypothetical protein